MHWFKEAIGSYRVLITRGWCHHLIHSVEAAVLQAVADRKMSEPWFALRELIVHWGRQDKYRWKYVNGQKGRWCESQRQAREHLVEGSGKVSRRRWDLWWTLEDWENVSRWRWDGVGIPVRESKGKKVRLGWCIWKCWASVLWLVCWMCMVEAWDVRLGG